MRFDYLEPESIGEALEMLSRHHGKAKVLAGGTDVMRSRPTGFLKNLDNWLEKPDELRTLCLFHSKGY